MRYPTTRLRRKRLHKWMRHLNRENTLSPCNLILPLFIHDNEIVNNIRGLESIRSYNAEQILPIVKEAESHGIVAIALFPIINKELKSENADESYNPHNLICRTIRAIKSMTQSIGIIADVALDPYTLSGHDGIIVKNVVDNDRTIETLCKQSLVLASSGCDIIAPSDMMDGRIRIIRENLDNCQFQDVSILSYSAKYCSSFYDPFRMMVGSSSHKIDKSTYQLDSANFKEALLEIELDIDEGADMVMVKPGLPYLDIIKYASDTFKVPIFSYQVSGEYAMIKAASDMGWINYNDAMHESLISLKRAGSQGIITYAALDIAKNWSLHKY